MNTLDVVWLPHELGGASLEGRAVIVIDVLRATTSITTALAAGAERVIPAHTVEQARALAADLPGTLLCGERGGVPPDGFDLGNSPGGFTPQAVGGRILVFTTTNGTAAIQAVSSASQLTLACFRNAKAVVGALARAAESAPGGQAPAALRDVLIVCSGRKGRLSMDDGWCAGHLTERIEAKWPQVRLSDGARVARDFAVGAGVPTPEGLAETAAGRAIGDLWLGDDLKICATMDDLSVVPVWRDGAFVKGGEEEG